MSGVRGPLMVVCYVNGCIFRVVFGREAFYLIKIIESVIVWEVGDIDGSSTRRHSLLCECITNKLSV